MIPLEKVVDGGPTGRNFALLARLVLDTGGVTAGVRFGVSSVTWPGGSATSNTKNVSHGLGSDPAVAFITGVGADGVYRVQSDPSSTVLPVVAVTSDGSTPANGTERFFYWLVIG